MLEEAQQRYGVKGEKIRLICEGRYRAGSWDEKRRVIYKAEATKQGPNPRFVVADKPDEPKELYEWYLGRGEIENRIKDFTAMVRGVEPP